MSSHFHKSHCQDAEEQGSEPSAVCPEALALTHDYTTEVPKGHSLGFLRPTDTLHTLSTELKTIFFELVAGILKVGV